MPAGERRDTTWSAWRGVVWCVWRCGVGAVTKERRKCPLRPLSSFEVHERLRRTKRRRSGYSLPFLLSRGVLPFPVEARTGEPLHGPFTITIIVDDGCRYTAEGRRGPLAGRDAGTEGTKPENPRTDQRSENHRFLGQLFLLHLKTSYSSSSTISSSSSSASSYSTSYRGAHLFRGSPPVILNFRRI